MALQVCWSESHPEGLVKQKIMVNVQHRFPAPRSEIYPEASALGFLGEPGTGGAGRISVAPGAWGDGSVSSVRNTGFLQSEGETLPGLEFHHFLCVTGWLVGWFLSWIILFTENSVSR